jgi:hypothetical protein
MGKISEEGCLSLMLLNPFPFALLPDASSGSVSVNVRTESRCRQNTTFTWEGNRHSSPLFGVAKNHWHLSSLSVFTEINSSAAIRIEKAQVWKFKGWIQCGTNKIHIIAWLKIKGHFWLSRHMQCYHKCNLCKWGNIAFKFQSCYSADRLQSGLNLGLNQQQHEATHEDRNKVQQHCWTDSCFDQFRVSQFLGPSSIHLL